MNQSTACAGRSLLAIARYESYESVKGEDGGGPGRSLGQMLEAHKTKSSTGSG